MSKHTPGPWFAVRNSSFWEVNPQRELGDYNTPFTVGDVCESAPGNPDGGLQEANARLIAAAPELLEALRWYVETDEVSDVPGNEFWWEGRERARAAIAKATGGEG